MHRSMLFVLVAAVGAFAALGIATPASAQCNDCFDVHRPIGWAHYFDDTTFEPMSAPHWDDSLGLCEEWHELCFAPEPETVADIPALEELVALVETADSVELSRLLDAHSTVITLNASRRAVQMLNCGGQVAAHIPIANDGLLHSLTAASAVATLGHDVEDPSRRD